MVRVLSLMYKDILNFHKVALRYFQKPCSSQISLSCICLLTYWCPSVEANFRRDMEDVQVTIFWHHQQHG